MPDFSSLISKPILPKAHLDLFPMVKQIDKPKPPVLTKSTTVDLLFKMQRNKVSMIIKAFKKYKFKKSIKQRIAAKKVSVSY